MLKNILFSLSVVLASVLVIVFGMTTYRYYQAIHSDDPISPYLAVETWEATIVRWDTAIDMVSPETYDIEESDIIITRADSQAVVNWPDHSTTRLGASSRLTISRMRVADDYSSIELVASLESGKAWSNIVRTMYAWSRVEFRLPRSGTVAGVRGTVFEINLDDNYIHSVDHGMSLVNSFGKSLLLLPGEAVLASDIFSRVWVRLDSAWISLNQARDTAYISLRDTRLRDTYEILAGSSSSIWDRFVRWILSWFPAFSSLDIIASMASGSLSDITTASNEVLMKWYQSFQSRSFTLERDQFRWALIQAHTTLKNSDQIIDTLMRWSFWDIQSYTGMTLKNTTSLISDYARESWQSLDTIISGLKKIDTNEIKNISEGLYERLLK